MNWQPVIKRFGVRFGICLVLLGGAYGLIFGFPGVSHNKPKTPNERVAAVRSSLAETYLSGSGIASFNNQGADAYYDLGQIQSQFSNAHVELQASFKAATAQLSTDTQAKLATILAKQDQASNDYKTRYSALSKVITYDPESDLDRIDIAKNASTVAERADSAQRGITKAASNPAAAQKTGSLAARGADTSTTFVTDATKQALVASADCFGRLKQQIDTRQTEQAKQTRKLCVASYPATRLLAIHNVTDSTFGGAYADYTKQTVPALLKLLDAQLKNNR